ncbi:type II toxin-antitoxin system PemK/MazF family toxin [Aeromonas salmonicida]|uniref:type II toxin-antitoxin system PemK/MazF family toxin n=1 Tax=Aeromonas salmonicida TaxID=645 RepID=UPI002240AB17|nr:type II toxin-antitoxin system PemK/MazF family toxin [Aeromonas salmonicida]MDQ1886526.1 type II toxin-antitoxin system PemK/MazF family toxin [Aeromonas salmonicida]
MISNKIHDWFLSMAVKLKVVYVEDGTRASLGSEEHEGITELLYPGADENDHVISITKKFEGKPYYRWKVCSVSHLSLTELEVVLSPRVESLKEEFLGQSLHDTRFNIAKSLSRGTLVEVDFGYIPLVKKSSGKTDSCKCYVDMPSKGEMHKRRLAVVVKANKSRVQVLPITSKTPSAAEQSSSFQLSNDTLKNLANYNDPAKNSYVIGLMIQTVSPTRVLPPQVHTRGPRSHVKRDLHYPNKLSAGERQSLETCLANAVGLGALLLARDERNEFRERLIGEQQTVETLSVENQLLRAEVDRLQEVERFSLAHRALLEDQYEGLYAHRTDEDRQRMLMDDVQAWLLLQEEAEAIG